MKLTTESNKLIHYFSKHKLQPVKHTSKTDMILAQLYHEIKSGVIYINNLKPKMEYKAKIDHITNITQIPKPDTFSSNAFPANIMEHINKHSIRAITYKFHLFNRNITIIFITENEELNENTYHNYVHYILVWLFIVTKQSSSKCADNLTIFIYHTRLLKKLPTSNNHILDENNVNTAFTRTCPVNSEIVVFRKEEWFKVFIHETFHNFGLDFSGMNLSSCNKTILELFPVKSDVNLFEAYTEFWARIMNTLFCSFITIKDKNDVYDFLTTAETFIQLERTFSFFQMVKAIDFMGLTYNDLYKKTSISKNKRNLFYKENTNVLSYYVITSILINNYPDLLVWCNEHNKGILHFTKTQQNLVEFCDFIKHKYKTKHMLDCVKQAERLLYKADTPYLLKNLRMTICELQQM